MFHASRPPGDRHGRSSPTQRQPNTCATVAVVPEPIKGSRTRSPDREPARMQGSISFLGIGGEVDAAGRFTRYGPDVTLVPQAARHGRFHDGLGVVVIGLALR